MSIITPFNKEGKKDMDLVDRPAIAMLFLFFAGLTILVIIKIAGLLRKPR